MKKYALKSFLARGILALSVFFIPILLAMAATLGPTAPILSRVESTTDGYALVGSGFGTDRNQVQVFEDSTQVPAASVVSVANDRIVVRSRPTRTVEIKVVVGRLASGVVRFTSAAVQDAAKVKADEEARKKAAQEATERKRASQAGLGVASVSLAPLSVVGGATVTGTVMLTDRAPTGGVVVTLTRGGGTGVAFPGQVTVAAEQTSATFEITTQTVTVVTKVTISARYGDITKTGQLELKPAFQPKSVTTGELTMTGLRFQPKEVTTGELVMTGLRFQPKTVTTSELTMTGLRFEPKSVTTGELTMTGLRE